MSAPVILSLGSANADFQMRTDQEPGASALLLGHDFVRLSGGKAANVAFLARRLGHPARLLARVGADELAEQALAPLRAAGVDLSGVTAAPGQATAVSVILVPPGGRKSVILAGNANLCWGEAEAGAAAEAVRAAPPGSLLVADYEVPGFVVRRAVEAARARGLGVVIDPSPAAHVDKALLRGVLAITPNPSETEGLVGIRAEGADQAPEAARRLAALGPRMVCLKLGDGGAVLAHEGRLVLIPPVPVERVDSTGAGDAFAGALAVALLEGQEPLHAACFAVAASTCAVTGYGSQPAYPTRERIEGLLPALLAGAHDLA